jgi:hypothetical protein
MFYYIICIQENILINFENLIKLLQNIENPKMMLFIDSGVVGMTRDLHSILSHPINNFNFVENLNLVQIIEKYSTLFELTQMNVTDVFQLN